LSAGHRGKWGHAKVWTRPSVGVVNRERRGGGVRVISDRGEADKKNVIWGPGEVNETP